MATLNDAFDKAYELHNSENPYNKVISKGFVFEMSDDVAVNFVKDKNNNAPYFLTNKFKDKTKGKKVNKHFWIFLKNYQKRGNSGKVAETRKLAKTHNREVEKTQKTRTGPPIGPSRLRWRARIRRSSLLGFAGSGDIAAQACSVGLAGAPDCAAQGY